MSENDKERLSAVIILLIVVFFLGFMFVHVGK